MEELLADSNSFDNSMYVTAMISQAGRKLSMEKGEESADYEKSLAIDGEVERGVEKSSEKDVAEHRGG